jgi:hypothetical protein
VNKRALTHSLLKGNTFLWVHFSNAGCLVGSQMGAVP